MSRYKELDKPKKFYRARLIAFAGDKCLDKPEIKLEVFVAIEANSGTNRFRGYFEDHPMFIDKVLEFERTWEFRSQESCPSKWDRSYIWSSTPKQAMKLLREGQLTRLNNEVQRKKTPDYWKKHYAEILEEKINEINEAKQAVKDFLDMYKAEYSKL